MSTGQPADEICATLPFFPQFWKTADVGTGLESPNTHILTLILHMYLKNLILHRLYIL